MNRVYLKNKNLFVDLNMSQKKIGAIKKIKKSSRHTNKLNKNNNYEKILLKIE